MYDAASPFYFDLECLLPAVGMLCVPIQFALRCFASCMKVFILNGVVFHTVNFLHPIPALRFEAPSTTIIIQIQDFNDYPQLFNYENQHEHVTPLILFCWN